METIKNEPVLWIVIPCYNEEEVLPITAPMFLNEIKQLIELKKISSKSRILFVNDGSKDRTWQIIENLSKTDDHYIGIAQSRNRGHQCAVLAGLMEAKDNCDIAISIDCDGQDDISAMERMVDAYHEGYDIVYGVRSDRESDTWFKRTTAQGYYRFLNHMGVEAIYNHADYRLTSSRVLQCFADYQEVNLFLRGMFPLVGFDSTSVYYSRHERLAGKSNYPLKKMLGLAIDGITSMSVKPITLIVIFGMIVSALGLIGIIWAIILFAGGNTAAEWASVLSVICLLGGFQILSIGIVGGYVGKTYLESKHRPRYIIKDRTWHEENS